MSMLQDIGRATARDRTLIASWRGEAQIVAEETDKVAALVAAVTALDRACIPHALIGGVAVGIHAGRPRATLDVDLAMRSDVERSRAVAALVEAGFEHRGTHAHSINFRHPSGEPVQLAVDPGFDDMIERAERFAIADVEVRIVRKDDLIAMKERAAADPTRRASKRLQDQADIALLREGPSDPDEGW